MRHYGMQLVILVLLLSSFVCFQAYSAPVDDYDDDYGEEYVSENTTTVNDPLEVINRRIYGLNYILDRLIFKPIAKGYRFIVPDFARKRIHRAVTNLTEPVTSLNSFLQGDVEHGFESFWRFTINSTFGLAGTFDVAKNFGLKERKEDFGQTAGVYGVGNGPYIMLPILGPSNVRDTFGRVVDTFSDPFTYILQDEALMVRTGIYGLDTRETTLDLLDQIEKTSLDPYATIRSLYTQKRENEVRNGERGE